MMGARRVPTPAATRSSTTLTRADYTDAYAVPSSADRTAEDWLRLAIEQAPLVERGAIRIVWRLCGAVMRDEPGHVFGCPLVVAGPDLAFLDVTWRSGVRANVFAWRGDGQAIVSTHVQYAHRGARALWTVIGPLHRLASQLLLIQAVRRSR